MECKEDINKDQLATQNPQDQLEFEDPNGFEEENWTKLSDEVPKTSKFSKLRSGVKNKVQKIPMKKIGGAGINFLSKAKEKAKQAGNKVGQKVKEKREQRK